MIENKFMCYQLAKTKTETIYELDLSAPYAAANTKESVAELLATYVPADAALGTIAKFHSEDANGSKFIWTYEWEQNEDEEKLFMLIAETYIDRVPNGEVVPTGTIEITENAEGIDVSQYALADVNVSGGGGDVVIFTYDDDWSCNMTYAEAKTYWTTYNLNTICPCQKVGISSSWVDMRFADDTMLPSLEAIFDFDDDVTEAIVVFSLEGQSTTFHVAYGNNGKLYKPNM